MAAPARRTRSRGGESGRETSPWPHADPLVDEVGLEPPGRFEAPACLHGRTPGPRTASRGRTANGITAGSRDGIHRTRYRVEKVCFPKYSETAFERSPSVGARRAVQTQRSSMTVPEPRPR